MARSLNLPGLTFLAVMSATMSSSAWCAVPAKQVQKTPVVQKDNNAVASKRQLARVGKDSSAKHAGKTATAAPVMLAAAPDASVPPVPQATVEAVPQPAARADAQAVPPPTVPAAEAPASQATAPQAPANPYAGNLPQIAAIDPGKAFNQLFYDIKMSLPRLPSKGESLLPQIKTVHPTGDKPLVVVTFKCPTEMIGVTPPPTKLLHHLVDAGMDGLNKSNLLGFNMQQVCM